MYNHITVLDITHNTEAEFGFNYHVANVKLPNDETVVIRSAPKYSYEDSLEELFAELFRLDDMSVPAAPETPSE